MTCPGSPSTKMVIAAVGTAEGVIRAREVRKTEQELKDVPIRPGSDLRKRRTMKAATAVASRWKAAVQCQTSQEWMLREKRETNSEVRKHRTETGDRKVGELVKKIQMKDPKVEKVVKFVRFGQEKYKKPERDAMLAGAGEEDKLFKFFDDITGKELHWQVVKQAREQELKYLRELGGRANANPLTKRCQRVQKRGQA